MILPKAVALSLQLVTFVGATDRVPQLNVEPVCKGIAEQGGVTFHDPSVPREKQNCIESEQAVRDQLVKQWTGFLADDRAHCINETIMGGESSYTELLTCLEMARDVRTMRAEAAHQRTAAPPAPSPPSIPPAQSTSPEAGASRAGANTAPPSSSMSSLPPAPTSPPRATPPNDVANLELDSLRRQLDRAKTEAENATTSEMSAQRKLVDAEAALQRTKLEAEQAKAEARRARDEAQAAKEAEAAGKRKLADAEAARTAAERQCQGAAKSSPGIGEQLRKWFRSE